MKNPTRSLDPPRGGYASQVIEAKVEWKNRNRSLEFFDLVAFISFLTGILVYVISGLYLLSQRNFDPSVNILQESPFSPSLLQQQDECKGVLGIGRRLSPLDMKQTIWDVFIANPHVIVIPTLLVPIVAALWLASLVSFSKTVAWVSVLISNCIPAYIGLSLSRAGEGERFGDSTVPLLLYLQTISLMVFSFKLRKQIDRAAHHMQVAVTILLKTTKIFGAVAVVQMIFLLSMIASFCFYLAGSLVYEVDADCAIVQAPYAQSLQKFYSIFFLWLVAFFGSARLVLVSMTVSAWFFEDQNRPADFVAVALKSIFTTSVPTIAAGSLSTSVAESVYERATSKYWFLDPWSCIAKVILRFFKNLLQMATRFSLITHALTAEGFFTSAGKAFDVITRNFHGAYVTDRVAVYVTELFSYSFAICLGLMCWSLTDGATSQTTLSTIFNKMNPMLFLVLVEGFLYVIRRPMIGICCIVLVQQYANLPSFMIPAVSGLFSACLSTIVLYFTAETVLNSIDTIFMLHAISRDGGHVDAEKKIYLVEMVHDYAVYEGMENDPSYQSVFQSDIPEAIPVDTEAQHPDKSSYQTF